METLRWQIQRLTKEKELFLRKKEAEEDAIKKH